MDHLKNTIIIISALMLLVLSGCSIRPKDGTFILESNSSSQNSKNAFDLKDIKVQDTADKTLIGWQGNGLVLYDKAGIYLFHYDTASLTPLLSVPNANLFFPTLSNNGKKIAYTIQNDQEKPALYISDADGKTDSMNLSERTGASGKFFAWSSGGKYIYSQYTTTLYPTTFAGIFNVSTGSPVMLKIKESNIGKIYDIDDQSDELLLSQFQNGGPALCVAGLDDPQSAVQIIDSNSNVVNASFLGNGGIAFLSGNTLSIVKTDQPKQKQTYSDVLRYGVSADKNYICLVETNSSGSSDIYVGDLQNGEIVNHTLVYKGFELTPDRVFFSPDDKKICISGSQKGTFSFDDTIMVLTLQ